MSPPEYKPEPEPEPVVQVVHTSYAVELLLHCKYLAAKILVFSISTILVTISRTCRRNVTAPFVLDFRRMCQFVSLCTLTLFVKKKLQITQNKVIRFILGLPSRSHIGVTEFSSACMLPVPLRVDQLKLNHMYNIVNGISPHYLFLEVKFRWLATMDITHDLETELVLCPG